MTLTDEQLKELAEFGAEFLGCPTDDKGRFEMPFGLRMKWWDLVGSFFNEKVTSPALAHLAKREMEKRGFDIQIHSWRKGRMLTDEDECTGPPGCGVDIQHSEKHEICNYVEHENEYIALWLAIREAVK